MFAVSKRNKLILLLALAATFTCSTGCVQELAQLLYVIKGHKVDPVFPGLKNKKVAIVCNSDAAAFGPDSLSVTMTKHIGIALATSNDKITLAAPAKVEEFIDANGWEDDSPAKLGEAVDADYVVVVDLEEYSIHEGATLYKGRSEWTVNAYDIENGGTLAFSNGPNQYTFPDAGRPSLGTSERVFESFYLTRLCDRISKQFITHDKLDSYADDALAIP